MPTDREIRGRALCDVGGPSKVGVGLLEHRTRKPAHYHTKEEEHLYALDGRATLYLETTSHTLVPGSDVCFLAGRALPHFLQNDGPETFRYLMVGERISDDEVVHNHVG